ncbi:MAG: signal peptidase II [Lachnospiraceae bacterium]|nr:signal peptidase II [Lachnospiraceae bacterium]
MKKVLNYILPLLGIALIVGLDQYTKLLTLAHVKGTEGFYIINKVLRIYFVSNEGMAWGMFQNKQIVFIIITPIVIAGLIYLYLKMPLEKKYIWMRICVVFLTGGAIGNLIDRIFRGEQLFHGSVVDMIYVELINFPVFNVADSFVSVGFVILVVMMFIMKDDDLAWLKIKRKEKDKNENN